MEIFIFIVTKYWHYDGFEIVAIRSSEKEAIDIAKAEDIRSCDEIDVIKYIVDGNVDDGKTVFHRIRKR